MDLLLGRNLRKIRRIGRKESREKKGTGEGRKRYR